MKFNHVENEFLPTGFSMQDSLNGVSELVKKFLTRDHLHEDKMSDWQLILSQSKANGCFYHDENLPQQNWGWPKNTWFQERLSRHLQEDVEFGHSEGEINDRIEKAMYETENDL